jgi:predicted DNA-binding transcriptional regulator YafY
LRVIKCLRLLQRNCYSVDDLAGQFRVSRRTVYRDLRLLAAAGVPLMRDTVDRCFHVPATAEDRPRETSWTSAGFTES